MKVLLLLTLLGMALAVQAGSSESYEGGDSSEMTLKQLMKYMEKMRGNKWDKSSSSMSSESESESEPESEPESKDSSMEEDKECEERKRRMEELKKKQEMLQKIQEVSKALMEQKMMLNHKVTFQFLEMCQCSGSAEMIKKYIAHKFGEMSYDDDDEGMDEEDSIFMSLMRMGMMEMSMDKKGMKKGDNGNSTVTTMATPSNRSGNSTESSEEGGEMHMMFKMVAMKLAKMDQREISMQLYKGVVRSMCTAASHFMMSVKKFEMYYAKYMSEHGDMMMGGKD